MYTNLSANIRAMECECTLSQTRMVVAWHMSVFMFGRMHIFASRNAEALKETQITVVSVRATDFFTQCTNRPSYFHVILTISGNEAGTLTTSTNQIHQVIPTDALHVKIMYIRIFLHTIHQTSLMFLSYVISRVFFITIKHI